MNGLNKERFGFGSVLRGTSAQLQEYRDGEPFLGGSRPYLNERSSALFDMLMARVVSWEESQIDTEAEPDPTTVSGIPPQEFKILADQLVSDCLIGHDGYGEQVPYALRGQPPLVYPQLSLELNLWAKAAFGEDYAAEMDTFSAAIADIKPGEFS